jgi:hypothetical protein
MSRGNSLPCSKGTDEGVRVFISEQICGFVQFEVRVIKKMAGELMTDILKNLLEAVASVLKASLQRS